MTLDVYRILGLNSDFHNNNMVKWGLKYPILSITSNYTMKNILIYTTLVLLFLSCSQQSDTDFKSKKIELTPEELLSIAFDDETELNENEVKAITNSFISSESKTSNNSNIEIKIENKFQLKNITTRSNISEEIPAYKVIVKDKNSQNIALVCGDKRFPFVYAYYGIDAKEIYDKYPYETLIECTQSFICNNISNINTLKDSLRESTLQKVSQELLISKEEIKLSNIENQISIKKSCNTRASIIKENDFDESGIAKFGPFVKVKWDCGMPYNRLMPQECSDNWLWDYRYVMSSTTVAVAQLLSFYRPNIDGVDWEYLCKNEEIYEESDYFGSHVQDPIERRNMVANLMNKINDGCKVSYSCSGSSVNMNDVRNYLKQYNINMEGQQNMNVTTIKNSIDVINPVLMYGQTNNNQGHTWIIDGYCTKIATRGSFFPGFNIYFHANMGMGKSYSGYYLVGSDGSLSFDASFAHFTKNMVTYIIKQ